jgi:tetratricopeptide (TPR) repeat protein
MKVKISGKEIGKRFGVIGSLLLAGIMSIAAPPPDKVDLFWDLMSKGKDALASGNNSSALNYYAQAVAIDGRNAEALKGLAQAQEGTGDKLSSAQTLLRLQNEVPTDSSLSFHAGELYESAGKTDDAISAYRKAVSISPGLLQAQQNLGELLIKRGNWQDAITTFKAIIGINPNLKDYYFRIADIYLNKLKDEKNGRTWLREATKKDPENDLAYQLLAKLMLEDKLYSETADLMKEIVTLHPQVAENHYLYGEALEGAGNSSAALTQYQAAVQAQSDYGEAYLGLGRTQLDLHILDEGNINLKKAVELLPKSAEAHYQRGRGLVLTNQDPLAMDELESAVKLDDKHQPALTELGKLYIRLERYPDAIRPLEQLYRLAPRDHYANYGLGLSYGKTGKENDGVRYFKTAYELKPEDFATIRDFGELYLRMEHWDDAARMFTDALKTNPAEKGKIYLWLGQAHYGAKRYSEAIEAFRDAIAASPQLMEAYYYLGRGYMAVDRPGDASAEFQHAISLDDKFIPARLGLGESYEAQKRYDDAIMAYEGAAAVDGTVVAAFEGWGRSLYLKGVPDDAETQLKKALALDDKSFEGHYWLGRIFEDRKMLPEAVMHYRKAAAVSTTNADCRVRLGTLLIVLKKPGEAITPLEEACKIEPNNYEAHFWAAKAYEQTDNYDPGIAHLLECIRIQPDSIEANYAVANLYRLKKDYTRTIQYYKRVAELDPTSPKIFNDMGEVNRIQAFLSKKWRRFDEELGYLDQAAENYQMYLALDAEAPNAEDVQAFLAGYEKYRVLQASEREKMKFPW